MKISKYYILLIVILLLFTSCSKAEQSNSDVVYVMVTATTEDQTTTPTLTPTLTITPTRTKTPTITPTPTLTIDCNSEEVDDFTNKVDNYIIRWKEIMGVANVTPRMSLPTVITQLQDLRLEINLISSPECAKYIKSYVGVAMSYDIKTLLDFLSMKTEEEVNISSERALWAWRVTDSKLSSFKLSPLSEYMIFSQDLPKFSEDTTTSSSIIKWNRYNFDNCASSLFYPDSLYTAYPLSFTDCGVMLDNQENRGNGVFKIIIEDKYNFTQLVNDESRMISLSLFDNDDIESTHKEVFSNGTFYYYIGTHKSVSSDTNYYTFSGVFISNRNVIYSVFLDSGVVGYENMYLNIARKIVGSIIN